MMKKFWIVLVAITLSLPLICGQAGAAVEIATGGIGDVLLFPLYDVRDVSDERTDGWQNYVVIENTSGNWTALHLRFRTWRACIEVYDHVILLSPYDVFHFSVIRATEAGTTSRNEGFVENDVILTSSDVHTLRNSGLISSSQSSWTEKLATKGLSDQGFTTDLQGELQAGYIEAIGLWQLENPKAPDSEDNHTLSYVVNRSVYGKSGDSETNVNDVLDALFYAVTDVNNPETAAIDWPNQIVITGVERGSDNSTREGLDCGNVLAGALEMGDVQTGRYELESAVALMDFRTDGTAHRDGYDGGAIVYPAGTMWWYDASYYDSKQVPVPSYYLNESWATTVGAGLRDGDNIAVGFTTNAQDITANSVDPYNANSTFNDIWSLDDVEAALEKSAIWNHYFTGEPFDGATLNTDIVLTFPTKHYHFFFTDWPYWDGGSIASGNDSIEDYWQAVIDYRKYIKSRYSSRYSNGPIKPSGVTIWDMEQNYPGTAIVTTDVENPPPSPWTPDWVDPTPDKTILHEVNIVRVGEEEGTGIHEANWLLNTNYTSGHFTIGRFFLTKGDREIGFNAANPHTFYGYSGDDSVYELPPIGVAIFTHTYGTGLVDEDGCAYVTRSSMTEWHYKK
ncbi:hypothetical protein [Desulfonema magnum]|uniref:Solute-binding protein family 5 domain-containing protein n=1 Tax=Desulfonema magnum TaxID=45655 RepID=A0A975GK86_9BACT|nr:hypothetical protein [Desulfonema magnum]QTA84479.1 Uncharacterized protein dnm_004750 [Desulfonema magnum]